MQISRRRMRIGSSLLVGLNTCFVLAFLFSRPPLQADGWSFLERQRPSGNGSELRTTIVADGLNFALARRPFGGWETASARLFMLINLPAYFISFFTFHLLQDSAFGSSKLNSDLATVVFASVAVAQWLAVAALLSVQRVSPRPA